MENSLISVKNLKKYYPVTTPGFGKTYKRAVDGVSFELHEGEVFGIVGESGCGKSSVAGCLTRLAKPTGGSVEYLGKNISALKGAGLKEYRKSVQLVFQNPSSSLNPKKKIGWLLNESLVINTRLSKAERTAEVKEILEAVELENVHAGRYPRELSGGQRQRVALALAIILKPKLVVADEPLSSLDVSVRAQILGLMKKLRKERGLSYVYISHDLNTVNHICDKVAVMYAGRFVETGPAREVFERRLHPYTKLLFDSIPRLGEKLEPVNIAESIGALPGWNAGPCAFYYRCSKKSAACENGEFPLEEISEGHFVRCPEIKAGG